VSLLGLGWPLAVAATALLLLARREARRRHELVLRVCHELRGPLTNALLALDRPVAPEPAGVRGVPGVHQVVAIELARARREVEQLRAAAAGRNRHDERRPIDLDAVVREVAAVYDATVRGRGRRVVVEGRPSGATMVGDRARLTQAIGNLTQNALDHGAGTVRVSIRQRGETIEVLVADEGQGLEVPIERLLRRPPRGPRGHGLRIVADALARHGGCLRAASTSDGTRLVAELPVAGVAARAVAR
jgi:signal transduction histidine kinase